MAKKDFIIPFLALLAIIGLLLYGPVPQDQTYHNFADKRKVFGIPNFFDVITNLPFAAIGIMGLPVTRTIHEMSLKHISTTFFVSFLLLTAGSSFYHFWRNNTTLVYDRIPITIIFMSFFAFIIHDRIHPRIGYNALILLNAIGLLSVFYWALTEQAGNGDLRWYALVQFYPILAIPLVLWLYPSSFNHGKYIAPIFSIFFLAKFAELFDKEIYHGLSYTISGHSIKHLLMALAGYLIKVMMERRVYYQHNKFN